MGRIIHGLMVVFLVSAVYSLGLADQDPAEKAAQAFKAGKYREAIQHYTLAIEQDPKNPNLWYNRGLCYYKYKLWAKARYNFDAVTGNLLPEAENYSGLAYTREGKWEKALDKFKRAAKLDPKALYFYHAALAADYGGKHQEAQELCREAIKADPDTRLRGKILALMTKAEENFKHQTAVKDEEDRLNRIYDSMPVVKTDTFSGNVGGSWREIKRVQEQSLENLFKHCYENRIPATYALDYLRMKGIVPYEERHAGGVDRVDVFRFKAAEGGYVYLSVDDEGQIHRWGAGTK